MTPGNYKLSIYRGDTCHWQFKLWRDEQKLTPVDLTGVTVKAQLRDRPDGQVSASLTCTVTPPNIINATLSAAASSLVVNGVWDLQLLFPGGDVTTVLQGPVVTTPDVTR